MKKSFIITALMCLAISANAKKLPINVTPYMGISYVQTKISMEDIKNAELSSLFNEDSKGISTNDIVVNAGLDLMYEKNIDKHKISFGGGASVMYSKSLSSDISLQLKSQPKKELLLEDEIKMREAEKELLELFKTGSKSLVEARAVNKMIKILDLEILANESKMKKSANKLDEFREIKKKYPTKEKVEELKKEVEEKTTSLEEARKKSDELARKRNEFIANHPEIPEDKLRENEEYSKLQDEYLASVREKDNYFMELLTLTIDYTTAKNVDKYIQDKTDEHLSAYARLKVLYKVKDNLNQELAKNYTPDDYEEPEEPDEDMSLEDTKNSIYEFEFEDVFDQLMEATKDYYDKYEEVNEMSNEYVAKQLLVEKNNREASVVLENSSNNIQKISGSFYVTSEYAYSLRDELELFTDLKLGLTVSNNPLYNLSKQVEKENVKIDGKDYLVPTTVDKVKYEALFNVGVGVRYNRIGIRLNAGYGSAKIVGLDLSYRF